ncbi:hypothetical protein ACSQ67_009227 [Phaseolus vulgaris]
MLVLFLLSEHMANFEKDEVPFLSDSHPQVSTEVVDSILPRHISRTQSVSISIPTTLTEPYERDTNSVGYTGPLRIQRITPFNQMSGPLHDTNRPENLSRQNKVAPKPQPEESKTEIFSSCCGIMGENDLQTYYASKNEHLVRSGPQGMCSDPYCTTCPTYFKATQQINHKENKCIGINWAFTKVLLALRSINDFINFLRIALQFRLAYVAPESRVVGAGELVDHPKKIALHYIKTSFFIDLFVVLPLPQIFILLVLQKNLATDTSGANYENELFLVLMMLQYFPRLLRFFPMRVNQCLKDACDTTHITGCTKFIYCGHGNTGEYQHNASWLNWTNNAVASACFTEDGFRDGYGIFLKAVNLTAHPNMPTRYFYSSFWGFQQLSTLTGNLTPSYYLPEVLFTKAILGSGLLLFALLIGNIQKILQDFGRRKQEMSIRQRDVEQWMSHWCLADHLRRRVRQAERFNWAATRGVNEEMLLENLPEDLQRDIRRHLFTFIKKVRIFALLDEHILDAICERLRQKTYIKGSKILYDGGLVEKMVFVVRGKLESVGEDGISAPLYEGSVCGEELLTWCLEHAFASKGCRKESIPRPKLVSNRTVCCLTHVKAFSLRTADLEEVIGLFARFFRNSRVRGAIRYESPYWRCFAATSIQNYQNMANFENDKQPMLTDTDAQPYDDPLDSKFRRTVTRTQSASISIPMSSLESYEKETSLVGHTGPLQSKRKTPFMHMSGPLYATTGTGNLLQKHIVSGNKADERKTDSFATLRGSSSDYQNSDYDRKNEHLLRSGQLGMCNDPYCTTCPTYFNASQQRNPKPSTRWDPKFHNALYGDAKSFVRKLISFFSSYVPGVMNPHAKVVQKWNKFLAIFCLISIFVDLLFFFCLYVEKDNKCILINWPLTTALALFRCLNDFVYFLNIVLQFRLAYVSRESRVVGAGDLVDHPKKIALHYLKGYFLIDLFVVFPLPQCLRNACHSSNIQGCMRLIDCGHGVTEFISDKWINNTDAVACLNPSPDGFTYGIYENGVPLTIETNIVKKYVYSLFGDSSYALDVLDTANQYPGWKLEMQLRGRDVEQWMSHRRLPEGLRSNKGVNEEMLMENLPEDLQRDIRRHLFKFVKKIRLFALMDEPILDAICERLRQKTHIKGSRILSHGGLVEKMVFVVRGKLESIGEDGTRIPLSEGDACGEELLTWYLEHSSVSTDGRKVRLPGQRLVSNRTVRCLTNVESFSLSASDLEEVTILFTRFLRSPCVQGAIRYESPYWRSLAATRIQVAWRYRKKRLSRANSSPSD